MDWEEGHASLTSRGKGRNTGPGCLRDRCHEPGMSPPTTNLCSVREGIPITPDVKEHLWTALSLSYLFHRIGDRSTR